RRLARPRHAAARHRCRDGRRHGRGKGDPAGLIPHARLSSRPAAHPRTPITRDPTIVTDSMDIACAPPAKGWRPAALAALVGALALAACAPDPAPAPLPAPRPSAVPAPEPRPDDLAQMRRDRAQAAREAASHAPGPASLTMAQYMGNVQDALLARGLLRPGADGIPAASAAQLTEDFIQIALHDEYVRRNGRLVPESRPAPLRRWERPVRVVTE